MAFTDVIPLGGGQFIIQFFKIPIPDRIGFDRYFEATLEIVLNDGSVANCECIACRPPDRRNVVGVRVADWLAAFVRTDIPQAQLAEAAISVSHYGAELSEQEAISRRNVL